MAQAPAERVPATRPWPDHVDVKACPHCGAEVGEGHYICWNCSNDVRAPSEAQMYDELQTMMARRELELEERNRAFWLFLVIVFATATVLSLLFWLDRWGMAVLFGIGTLLTGRVWWRSSRRIRRIRAVHGA